MIPELKKVADTLNLINFYYKESLFSIEEQCAFEKIINHLYEQEKQFRLFLDQTKKKKDIPKEQLIELLSKVKEIIKRIAVDLDQLFELHTTLMMKRTHYIDDLEE